MEHSIEATAISLEQLSYENFRQEVLHDYRWVCISRETSLISRKEVLTGKAKFGIFGDGKEVAQVAMAKFFQPGDFRSGYYRDQTFMFAAGLATVEQFFAQLYADPNDPFSAGRQMNAHFATPFVAPTGEWLDLANRKNVSADISTTAGQMARGLGLALASKCFRQVPELRQFEELSHNGNEVCFCTIGDASTSEGQFWETVNAAGVMQVPLAIFVWDDGYGISVPKKYQTTKGSISEALAGFQKEDGTNGFHIYRVKGWDYAALCEAFEEGIRLARETHTPVLFHVEEITQPQGHSTSGSHERYKDKDRLAWEREWDGLVKMREWILANNLAEEGELLDLENEVKEAVRDSKNKAWEGFLLPVKKQMRQAIDLMEQTAAAVPEVAALFSGLVKKLLQVKDPMRRDIMVTLHAAVSATEGKPAAAELATLYKDLKQSNGRLYHTHLYHEGPKSPLLERGNSLRFDADAPILNGYEILNRYFDQLFANNPKIVAFGEDVGHIGDVNQGFAGLQAKYGTGRIFDTGIRELTIMGQGAGLAMRGLRPIAEIQYLDYLLYGLQELSDDVATLHYRCNGQQSVPMIVRTRGHRLEGIWHSGSPMAMLLGSLRGMHLCVPRNMVQAAGIYNTLLRGNDPAVVVECLNGYRLKERLPANLAEYTVPLGVPEIVHEGSDVTIVSYGSTLRVVQEALPRLEQRGISCEVVDVQTLLPFDVNHLILQSLKKTNRILFVDEDVPGGATAYMFQKVMEEQGGYRWLDVAPRTLSAKAHRPAYGSDGDYFSKPNAEEIETVIRQMMAE
ncbi:alpha-ketoacid dehydrogenase subunit alpha/beta [Pseudocnuella soli]|uniref:alpha-ketoacid dehydrogenase subunit alpha/beta n=1 Tax=Pseudocnuella soli TaxID=2502779 RepID=UPI00104CA505|nr:alpha-ketoacid dehydrogenase subunit alpha/beta [Pseudocnuella soli]